MKPAEFPVEHLGDLARQLTEYAGDERAAALVAARDGNHTLQHGHAEAAFAYASAASQTDRTIQLVLADIDRAAARQDDPHTWPIAGLVNLDTELNRDRSELIRQRHPQWGIPVEHLSQDTYIGLSSSARDGEVLLCVLTGSDTSDNDFLNIDIQNWRALNLLVERIAAHKPTPYNVAGNVHTNGGK